MDPTLNPFSPGAGTPPPALVGRDDVRELVRVAAERLKRGRSGRPAMLIGLRGVGKTVLLDRMRDDAEASGCVTLRLEARSDQSLPGMLAPELRVALLRLSRVETARDLARRGLRGLAGFVGAMKLKYQDVEVALDFEPEEGLADNGDLEYDLQSLLEAVGQAARSAGTVVLIHVDELQYVDSKQLAALIAALHRISQRQLPVTLVGAGLPQLPMQLGKAKSYAERLFVFPEIDALPEEAAREALFLPAEEEGVTIEEDAMKLLLDETKGYPYFLQEWGSHAWDVAEGNRITAANVRDASTTAVAALDASFFRVRFDQLTPKEKIYMRAMAELGDGPHRSGDIGATLNRPVQSVAPLRHNLIQKGMLWSPGHGKTAFTVPLFAGFMHRVMPGDDWRKDA